MNLFGRCIFVVVAGWMVGCAGKALARTPPSAPASPTKPVGFVRKEPPVPGPAILGKRPVDAPDVELGVVFSTEDEKVFRGWPLLVEVEVSHPEAGLAAHEQRDVTPLRLIPASGGWGSLVSLRFLGPAKAQVSPPLVPVVQPQGELLLDARARVLRWYLGPAGTRTLMPGLYNAFATLEASHGALQGGWMGRVDSLPVRFEVVDEPASPPPEWVEHKAVVFAQYEVYRGDSSAALAVLDAHLAAAPDSPSALAFKAELLESAGDLEGAAALYGQALTLHFQKFPDAREPPVELMLRVKSLRQRLNQGSAP